MNWEDRLIEESRALIAEVATESTDAIEAAAGVELAVDDISPKTTEETVHGTVEVDIAEDLMSATAAFYPARGFGRPLTVDSVYGMLDRSGVTSGIEQSIIEAAVFTCNTERTALHGVEVAFGREPVDEVPARMELTPLPAVDPPEQGGRLDYRACSPLPLVKAGDIVARTVSGNQGSTGMSITGKELSFRTLRAESLKPGANTALDGDELRATVDGLLHTRGATVSVSPTLVVEGNVDYHTGNIDFRGDVLLNGHVGDGFSVRCGGLLHAAFTLDSYSVSCGTLIARQGLIGHNGHVTRVEESATLRFVQNARLEAQGTISVGASILNSHVTSAEQIKLGPGSTVIGSVLRAQTGMRAANIGAPGAAATEIYLGIDFGVDERLATIRDQTVALTEKLQQVRRTQSVGSGNRSKLAQLEDQLHRAIAQLAEEAGDLVVHLDRDDEAELVVRGTVYPGTYIEICHRSHLVQRKLSACRFLIDKACGAVITEPLTSPRSRG